MAQSNLQIDAFPFLIVWLRYILICLNVLYLSGIFHVEGVLKPTIFESLPWAYMSCKCPQILIGERHWPTELGIGHLWSWVGFINAQIWAKNLAIIFQYPHMS